jgi:hypothetical protein
MTISLVPEDTRLRRFECTGGETVFAVTFPVFAAADVQVVRLRAGVTVTLTNPGDYTLSGIGAPGGFTVTLTAPALAGDLIVVVSAQPVSRSSEWTDGQALRAQALNAEFARYWIAAQQLARDLSRSVRLPITDGAALAELPSVAQRASKLLGFDAAGAPVAVSGTDLSSTSVTPLGGTTPRLLAELLRAANPRHWGGVGDGIADDTVPLQAAADYAAAQGLLWWLPEGTWRTTGTVTVAAAVAGLRMDGALLYNGPAGQAALVVGDLTQRMQGKSLLGLDVRRAALASWTDEGDVGILLRNLDACYVLHRRVEGFTIGIRTLGSGISGQPAGFEDTTLILGRIVDCRYGLDIRCSQPGPDAWNNGVRYIGGHFANAAATHPTLSRFGVRFSAAPGAYDLHNHHVFLGPNFELNRQGTPGTVDAIPFLVETSGRGLLAYGVRMENCSRFVARHAAAQNDAVYEVAYVGTYGFLGCAVDYPPSATRAGGSVVALPQAAAAQASPRLLAEAGNLRRLAYRDVRTVADGVGFQRMAIASSNPTGSPTTLDTLLFGGATGFTLNAESIVVPTSRALGFVLDLRTTLAAHEGPKELFLGAEGSELRGVVMQFDTAEDVLDAAAPVLWSNANAVFAGAPSYWWEMNVNLDTLTGGLPVNALQRVTLHPSCAIVFIGVRGGSASAVLKALRVYASPLVTPHLLYGGARPWGGRTQAHQATWDPPSIGANSSTHTDITVSGARPGDHVAVGVSPATILLPLAHVVATDTVRVRLFNHTGSAIDAPELTLQIALTRPPV